MAEFSINKQGRSYIRGEQSNLFLTIPMRSSKVDKVCLYDREELY